MSAANKVLENEDVLHEIFSRLPIDPLESHDQLIFLSTLSSASLAVALHGLHSRFPQVYCTSDCKPTGYPRHFISPDKVSDLQLTRPLSLRPQDPDHRIGRRQSIVIDDIKTIEKVYPNLEHINCSARPWPHMRPYLRFNGCLVFQDYIFNVRTKQLLVRERINIFDHHVARRGGGYLTRPLAPTWGSYTVTHQIALHFSGQGEWPSPWLTVCETDSRVQSVIGRNVTDAGIFKSVQFCIEGRYERGLPPLKRILVDDPGPDDSDEGDKFGGGWGIDKIDLGFTLGYYSLRRYLERFNTSAAPPVENLELGMAKYRFKFSDRFQSGLVQFSMSGEFPHGGLDAVLSQCKSSLEDFRIYPCYRYTSGYPFHVLVGVLQAVQRDKPQLRNLEIVMPYLSSFDYHQFLPPKIPFESVSPDVRLTSLVIHHPRPEDAGMVWEYGTEACVWLAQRLASICTTSTSITFSVVHIGCLWRPSPRGSWPAEDKVVQEFVPLVSWLLHLPQRRAHFMKSACFEHLNIMRMDGSRPWEQLSFDADDRPVGPDGKPEAVCQRPRLKGLLRRLSRVFILFMRIYHKVQKPKRVGQ